MAAPFPPPRGYAPTAGVFIGHYAPALVAAAHPRAPRLGLLFVAAQLVDIAFFGFVLLGVEHMRLTPGATLTNALDLYDMPFTHSLIGSLSFAAGWAVATRLAGRRTATAWIGAAVVASHWLLDWLVHAPDLTILGRGPRYGLGLWNWPTIEMPLELGLTACALGFYASRTTPRGRAGRAALPTLGAALLGLQLVDWLSPQPAATVDPPPASVFALALAAFTLLALLAAWTARTRAPAPA